jgi:hypothetical protein
MCEPVAEELLNDTNPRRGRRQRLAIHFPKFDDFVNNLTKRLANPASSPPWRQGSRSIVDWTTKHH